jgi:DNA-binding HxlR family transcriptional regulator
LILREAFAGALRFDEFAARTGISDKALSARLKEAVSAGLIERVEVTDGLRPRAEYRLTESGADALPILHAFALWADKHASHSELGALGINCRTCCARAQSADVCLSCGSPLTAENTRWTRPGEWDGAQVDLVGVRQR